MPPCLKLLSKLRALATSIFSLKSTAFCRTMLCGIPCVIPTNAVGIRMEDRSIRPEQSMSEGSVAKYCYEEIMI
jgi:hypothetical protein